MDLRKRAFVSLGAVTVLCALGAACTPAGPSAPPSTPTPTPMASPTETQLERQQRLDFEAAEKAYRTFSAEYIRIAHHGGSKTTPPALKEVGAGPYLKAFARTSRQQYEAKARLTGNVRIAYVHRGSYSDAKLTLSSCEDGSSIRVYDSNGQYQGGGSVAMAKVDARLIAGHWKVWDTAVTGVKQCPEN